MDATAVMIGERRENANEHDEIARSTVGFTATFASLAASVLVEAC